MIQRKIWTQEVVLLIIQEDSVLKKLKNQVPNLKWNQIAQIMSENFDLKQRTGKQCRERFENHLIEGINKSPWTRDQEIMLLDLHLKHGNKWVYISELIQNFRTPNNTKNNFMSLIKKSMRKLNKVLCSLKIKRYRSIELSFLQKFLNIRSQCNHDESSTNCEKDELCRKIEYNITRFREVEGIKKQYSQQLRVLAIQTYDLIKKLKTMNKNDKKPFKKNSFRKQSRFQDQICYSNQQYIIKQRKKQSQQELLNKLSQFSAPALKQHQEDQYMERHQFKSEKNIEENLPQMFESKIFIDSIFKDTSFLNNKQWINFDEFFFE